MQTNHWDVIVIGAGQAGCAAAWDLAAGGARVLLVHTGPQRRKPCAGGVTVKAVRRYRFPLDPVVRARIHDLALSRAGRGQTTVDCAAPFCVMTERRELDDLCRRQALEKGVDWVTSKRVRRIREDRHGVALTSAEGRRWVARYLIAADGAHSPLRRLLQGQQPGLGAVALEAHLPRERAGRWPDMTLDFQQLSGGYGWLFPKGDHINLGLYTWRRGRHRPAVAKLRQYALDALGCDRLEAVAGHPIGTWLNRRPLRCGRILFVGDAAGTTEPLLGEGIYGAVLSGQLAASALLAERPADYPLLMAGWRDELGSMEQLARLFYGLLPVSYPVLSRWLAPVLLDGYADGLTLGQAKRRWRGATVTSPSEGSSAREPAC